MASSVHGVGLDGTAVDTGRMSDAERMTLFVGAGISVPSGAPDFWSLRNAFLVPLIGQQEAERLSSDLLSPELTFDALDDGRPVTRRLIRAAIWHACERTRPGPNHTAVARLGASGATVWTTNFDTLIERAARRAGIPATVVAAPQAPEVGRRAEAGGVLLLKPHGSFPFTGDPPVEPREHDYELLFRSGDVWAEPEAEWIRRLEADIADHDVHLFGYRGADLDIVPVLMRLLPTARSVNWWEVAGATESLERLESRFGSLGDHVRVRPGDPSAALQDLAAAMTGEFDRASVEPMGADPAPPTVPRTWTARAALVGQFRGAAAARRAYAMAVLADPVALKRPAALRLLRSTGFDRPAAGWILVRLLGWALEHPREDQTVLWELYATFVDAQPPSTSTPRQIARLLDGPAGGSPAMRVRAGSLLKRLGALERSADLLAGVLSDLRTTEPDPRLEAMASYNLAWVRRQQWELTGRAELSTRFAERLAHIGFNWAAWLQLDDALLALGRGDDATAGHLLDGPFLLYARSRLRHPMYLADETLVRALLRWHREGPAAAEPLIRAALVIAEQAYGRTGTSALEARLVLADALGAQGMRAAAVTALDEAEWATSSPLMLQRIALVRARQAQGRQELERLAGSRTDVAVPLIALTAAALLGRPTEGGPVVSADLPLPGLV